MIFFPSAYANPTIILFSLDRKRRNRKRSSKLCCLVFTGWLRPTPSVRSTDGIKEFKIESNCFVHRQRNYNKDTKFAGGLLPGS